MDTTAPELVVLPLGKLAPHPDNVRRHLGDLTELSKSIAGTGILEPLLVLPANDKGIHLVVAGHRRLAGAKKAGVSDAPCVIRDLTEVEVLESMLVENLQRADITPIEEARAYGRLVELDTKPAEIARKVGRSQQTVKDRIALLALPAKVLDHVEKRTATLGDAAQWLKHADDQEAMRWLGQRLDEKAKGAYAATNVGQWVADRDRNQKIGDLRKKYTDEGTTLYVPKTSYWSPPYSLTLTQPCRLSDLGLDTKQRRDHEKEPCHAVWIDSGSWGRQPKAEVLCTNPKRHSTKATKASRSEIQMKPATYAGSAITGGNAVGPGDRRRSCGPHGERPGEFFSGFDSEQPDGLLLALAEAPGVEEGSIRVRSWPARGHHGVHAVQWTQDGRNRAEEGNTLATALRRAVAASGGRSAAADPVVTRPLFRGP